MMKNKLRISILSGVILFIFCQNTFSHPFDPSPIGTLDHPTINGGRIDTRIKKTIEPANHTSKEVLATEQSFALKENQLKGNVKHPLEHSSNLNQKSSPTDWMNSQKVEKVLQQAAQGGKLSYVLKKAQEKGLPPEVAIIPMIESRYNTGALSTKGAAGAWQLMPSVAKDYGIDNNLRFDFAISTNVALDYLKDLHKRFKNWDLVLVAYNAGSGRLLKAIQKKPIALHVDELDLPKETHFYLRRFRQTYRALGEIVGYET